MLRALLCAGLLFAFAGCGGTPCKSACDCPALNAPIKCPGEWICNASSQCEYSCKNTCDSSGVSTCRVEDTCNGTICSSRTGCK